TGVLGAVIAAHLVEGWGVRHVVLVSRRGGRAPGVGELVARLGVEVSVVAADVADPVALGEVVAGIDPAHPLTGVIHAAGIVDDGVVADLTPQR
ncbi:KR domain-containing protein, partial [Streptomyces sp. 7R007]